MDVVAAVSLAASIVFFARHLSLRDSRRAGTLAAAGLPGQEKSAPGLRSRLLPMLQGRLSRLGRMASQRPGSEVETLLAESGTAISVPYFQGLRLAGALAAAVSSLFFGRAALLLAPVLVFSAYRLPVFFLKRRRSKRCEQIASDLPEVTDLMAVLCFSGESLVQALRHSAAACVHAASRREMEAALERISLGESAAESLRRTACHPCPELRRFSRSLIRAEEHGAPVADTLEELANELRSGRREKERLRASRASVFILFPLVFLILPSFLLLTIGGMLLGYTL